MDRDVITKIIEDVRHGNVDIGILKKEKDKTSKLLKQHKILTYLDVNPSFHICVLSRCPEIRFCYSFEKGQFVKVNDRIREGACEYFLKQQSKVLKENYLFRESKPRNIVEFTSREVDLINAILSFYQENPEINIILTKLKNVKKLKGE